MFSVARKPSAPSGTSISPVAQLLKGNRPARRPNARFLSVQVGEADSDHEISLSLPRTDGNGRVGRSKMCNHLRGETCE